MIYEHGLDGNPTIRSQAQSKLQFEPTNLPWWRVISDLALRLIVCYQLLPSLREFGAEFRRIIA
jgi:hypothetical protein